MKKIYLIIGIVLISLVIPRHINAGDGEFIILRADEDPVIDGVGDEAVWDEAEWHSIDVFWISSPVDSTDFWGRFKATWTADRLYLLAEINDNERSDDHGDPVVDYWQDDCLEIFIDEDNSGGIHQYNFNAFAYHVSLLYDAVDLADDHQAHLFNDHVEVVRTDDGNYSTWELGIDIYDDTYDMDGVNEPVALYHNKDMGLSLAYCDNDETTTRETFIGSVETPNNDNDQHWINASEFGLVYLIDPDDDVPPVATIDADYGVTTSQTVWVDVTFSEFIDSLTIEDFIITNGIAANLVVEDYRKDYTFNVTADAAGEVTITLPAGAVTDLNGLENSEVSASYTYAPTAVDEVLTDDIRLFPNPSNGYINVEIDRIASMQIYSSTGALVMQIDKIAGGEIDLTTLPGGIYHVQIMVDGNILGQTKLVVE
ncbi:MAG: T9SS type A sorting domain-containing protein [Bacteroidales bacterium]|nr:T9SS type A sorting domain-containing protein [Bacteroidales bacterium]